MLILSDCLTALKDIQDQSIDAIVTDPPYGISFLTKDWDKNLPDPQVWAECLRVLKPGGYLLSFAAAKNYHRMAVQIEDQGFQVVDFISWVYSTGMPKNGKARAPQGWGTCLKPAHEPIAVCRKPPEGSISANYETHGTGFLNIDGSRVPYEPTDVPQGTGGFPTDTLYWSNRPKASTTSWDRQRANYAKSNHETPETPSKAVPYEPNDLGRYPTNVIGEIAERPSYFYCPKVSKGERQLPDGSNTHPTVKPLDLMRYLVKLVTPQGGTVLDPFMGSGSTGVACLHEGFDFIGIERDPDYYEIAKTRMGLVK